MMALSRGGIPNKMESLIKTSKRKRIFTTKECIKVQRYKTRTQDKSFHETTKEKGGRERIRISTRDVTSLKCIRF
jgi:hypothetical protein